MVAFPEPDPERLGALVGPGDEQPHRLEVPRLGLLKVTRHKDRRANHHRHALFADGGADGAVLERARDRDDGRPRDQRQPEARVDAEDVEVGQVGQDDVGRAELERAVQAFEIGEKIAVGERDHLRRALAAALEQDDRVVVVARGA